MTMFKSTQIASKDQLYCYAVEELLKIAFTSYYLVWKFLQNNGKATLYYAMADS